MYFDFGCARRLYDNRVHPRVMLGAEEIADLRVRVRSGRGKKLMTAMRMKVRPLADALAETDDAAGMLAHHNARTDKRGELVLPALADIALVGVIDEDAACLDAVRKALAAVPEADLRHPRDTYSLGYASWGNVQNAYDLAFNAMTPVERKSFARWAAEISVGESLKMYDDSVYFHNAGMNVPVVGTVAAFLSLLAVEGDAGAGDLSRQKARLMRRFEASLFAAIGLNGYPVEDIGYGSGIVSLLARVGEALRRAGIYDPYTQCPRYAKFGRAMLHFAQPWGKVLSNTGDYGADFGWRGVVFPRLAAETNDPVLLWLHGTLSYPIACSGPMDMKERLRGFPEVKLDNGLQAPVEFDSFTTLACLGKPVHPSRVKALPTQYMDPTRGIVTLRSSWRPDATFVVFDGSHRTCGVQGHNHDSGGHFSLSALGEYFAIDTGRYCIEQDQHNVVLVDGKSGHSTDGQWRMSWYQAALTRYEPGEFVDTASVSNSQMSDCYWSFRHIGLVKGRGAGRRHGPPAYVWIVDDVNRDNSHHEFWWTLNTNPRGGIKLTRGRATVVGADHGHMLDVFFALPAPDEYPTDPHRIKLVRDVKLGGSHAYMPNKAKLARDYARLVGNEEWGPIFRRPRLIAKVAGLNGRFISFMIPRRKGETPARVKTLASVPGTIAARITFDEVEDTMVWAYEHFLIEAGGVSGRGRWCVVRRSRKTGRVLQSALGEGHSLAATREGAT